MQRGFPPHEIINSKQNREKTRKCNFFNKPAHRVADVYKHRALELYKVPQCSKHLSNRAHRVGEQGRSEKFARDRARALYYSSACYASVRRRAG